MNLCFISTAVAALGNGKAGGVSETITLLAKYCHLNNHTVTILAPKGSISEYGKLIQCEGACVEPAQKERSNCNTSKPTVIDSYINHLNNEGHKYDKIINVSYDIELFDFTLNKKLPIYHYISMSSIGPMHETVNLYYQKFPHRLAFLTDSQRHSFSKNLNLSPILYETVNIDEIPLNMYKSDYLVFANRISPEKGLENALYIANKSNSKLIIAGFMEDQKIF